MEFTMAPSMLEKALAYIWDQTALVMLNDKSLWIVPYIYIYRCSIYMYIYIHVYIYIHIIHHIAKMYRSNTLYHSAVSPCFALK